MANGQLSRKAKMVREPKSDMDMVIPCLEYLFPNVSTIENTANAGNE